MIVDGSKQRLLGGSAPAQGEAADTMMIEVNFATHQAVRPVGAYGKAPAEQVRMSGFVGAADEDHLSLQGRIQVELEVLEHGQAWRGGFCNCSRAGTLGRDVTIRAGPHVRGTPPTGGPPHIFPPNRA